MSSKHIARAGGLTGTPSSVTIDVYGEDDPSTPLATIPNGDIERVGTSNVYQCDLRASSVAGSLGLPADGSPGSKSYTLLWTSDAAVVIPGTEVVSGIQDRIAIDRMFRKETPVYASSTIPSRGITAGVIAGGNPSYIRIDLSPDIDDFSSPASTYYDVFYYDASGRVEMRLPSSTPPAP